VSDTKLVFTLRSAEQARKVHKSGLQHKILTMPEVADVSDGDSVVVALEMPFADETFDLPGRVMHSGSMATVVQLDFIPSAVYEAMGLTVPEDAGQRFEAFEETLDAPSATEASEAVGTEEGDSWDAAISEADGTVSEDDDETVSEPSPVAPAAPPAAGDTFLDEAPPEASSVETSGEFTHVGGSELTVPVREQAERPSPQEDIRKPRPVRTGRKAPSERKSHSGGYVSARTRQPAQPPPPEDGIPVPGGPGGVFAGKPADAGSLAKKSMREVYMELLHRRATGLLVVDGFRERYWGYFVNGRPLRYVREPASRSESIEYQVSRQRLLKPAEMERARYAAGLSGLQLDDALVRLGLLNRKQVDALTSESARMVTDRLLGVNFGHYRFFDLPEIKQLFSGTPVDVAMVLWERSRNRYTGLNEKQVREIVDQHYKHHLVLTDDGRQLAEPLIETLAGQEQRWMRRYLRGGWQLSELLGRLEMPTRHLIELVLALQDLGAVELNEREGERWRESRAERFIIDRMDYMERDHFHFVESHWSCLPPELARACDKVARTIEDPIMEHLELDKLNQMRDQIRAKLAEVRALFADQVQRRAYRSELIEESKRRMAGELFHKQGEMELFKGDIPKARECFERVLELDPGGSGSGDRISRARKVIRDLDAGREAKPEGPAASGEAFEDINLDDLD